MTKRHVGRPTNVELERRKRNKLLKIIIPITLLVFCSVLVLTRLNLSNLMGNSTSSCRYVCDDGWVIDKDMCVAEEKTETVMGAYLLGDANFDGQITEKDYAIIKQAIASKIKLDDRKTVIYDLNQDYIIDENDISVDYFSSTSGKASYSNRYVCLSNKSEEKTYSKITHKKSIVYSLQGKKCNTTITITKQKNATKVCKKFQKDKK